jgi:hypothetical protein
MARVTTSLNVRSCAAAYARSTPMTLPEILKVMGCAGSATATGRGVSQLSLLRLSGAFTLAAAASARAADEHA